MKKTVVIAVLLSMFLGVSTSSFAFRVSDPVVIGLSVPSLGWPYIAAIVSEYEKIAAAHDNIRLIVLSADGSIEKQANDIDDLVVQDVDIILVCSLDGEAVIPALAMASGAGSIL